MGHSHRLRLREIRAIHGLVGRITESGDRPDIWRRIAMEGLMKLLGASMGLTVDIRTKPDGEAAIIDPLDTGWQTESARRRYLDYLGQELNEDPSVTRLKALQKKREFVTITRHELIEDKPWYDSPTVSEARRMADVNDFVVTTLKVGPHAAQGFVFYRPWQAKPFESRERRILRLFHAELARAMRENGSPQPIFGDVLRLSPRLMQTLELMLTDRSLKEIAAVLELSRHTVNDYQKKLYRMLRVNNRAGLMALFRPSRKGIRLPQGLL